MIGLNGLDKFVVFLDSVEGLEYKYKKFIIENFNGDFFDDLDGVLNFFKKNNAEVMGKSLVSILKDKDLVERRIERCLEGADGVITLLSKDEKESYYPKLLAETPVPPLALYYKGNKELLKEKFKLSVVGSRKTLPQYLTVAEKISGEIASKGGVVVTGIADGADSAAIKGALPCGRIISVQVGGINPVTPSGKQNLANEIAKNGLLIGENPYGYVAKNFSYPIRNRIIAALAQVTLIVSGSDSSGTRYTADYANDYGREIACLPYGLGVKSGELNKNLLKNGAAMVETAEEVAYLMKMPYKKQTSVKLSEKEEQVYSLIMSGVNSTDMLVLKTEMKVFELMAITVSLEMKGLIVKNPDGRYDVI